jgi:nucleotide-binding universal stress UspA family protein
MIQGDDTTGPILVAYDGSDFAKAAIKVAAAQLAPGREAIVLTVCEPLEAIPFLGMGGAGIDQNTIDTIVADTKSGAAKVADEGVELARAAGLDARALVETGDPPWQRITEVADKEHAGVIVLGSRGRSGLRYALLGSVATAVAHHSKRPVLIVHDGSEDPA